MHQRIEWGKMSFRPVRLEAFLNNRLSFKAAVSKGKKGSIFCVICEILMNKSLFPL